MITVESVEIVEEECDVFDIQVDEDESFIVGGVVVHNSEICRAWDPNRVYKLDDPRAPHPPFHPGCRTTESAVIDWAAAGLSAPADDGALRLSDYSDWLQNQGPTAQDSILGKSRAEMWRSGKVTLRDLVGADLRPLTLEQLRAKYAELFGKVAA